MFDMNMTFLLTSLIGRQKGKEREAEAVEPNPGVDVHFLIEIED